MTRALLLAFALAAAPALAQQAPAPAPADPPKAPERRPLDLRLDNPSSFATVAPAEKPSRKDLPTLGGDARKFESSGMAGSKSDGGPYPKDMNPDH